MGRFYNASMEGAKNKWAINVGKAMVRSAERRKCPECGRKGAIKSVHDAGNRVTHRVCRYCPFEDSTEWGTR